MLRNEAKHFAPLELLRSFNDPVSINIWSLRDLGFDHALRAAHFSLAPFGTSSVKVAITGRPSGPNEAATTIPCDS